MLDKINGLWLWLALKCFQVSRNLFSQDTLFNKVRSSEIRKSLNIEPLLLRIERSQLRWFGHVSRMPQERLPKQALHAKAMGEDQSDDLELDGPITLRILDGIAWDFTQVK